MTDQNDAFDSGKAERIYREAVAHLARLARKAAERLPTLGPQAARWHTDGPPTRQAPG